MIRGSVSLGEVSNQTNRTDEGQRCEMKKQGGGEINTEAPLERLGTGSSLSSPNTVEFFYRFVLNNFKSLSLPSWLTQYPCSNWDNDGAVPRLTLCALQPLKSHISTLVFRSCSTWCTQRKKITRSEHKPENIFKKSVVFLKSKKKVRGSPLTFRFQIKQTSL